MKEFLKKIFLLFESYIYLKFILKYKKIKPFNFDKWHLGYAYFIVEKDNQEYFIKIDRKLHLLQNDLLVYKLVDNDLKNFLIPIKDYFFSKKIQILVYEYKNSAKELSEYDIIKNPNLIDDVFYILKKLNSIGIIHRDIKLDNFLLINNKELKIIDFTFAVSFNKQLKFKELDTNKINHVAILESLGDGKNPKPFYWNDCFSINKILKETEKKYNVSFNKSLNCKEFVTYYITPSDRYFKLKNLKKHTKAKIKWVMFIFNKP